MLTQSCHGDAESNLGDQHSSTRKLAISLRRALSVEQWSNDVLPRHTVKAQGVYTDVILRQHHFSSRMGRPCACGVCWGGELFPEASGSR